MWTGTDVVKKWCPSRLAKTATAAATRARAIARLGYCLVYARAPLLTDSPILNDVSRRANQASVLLYCFRNSMLLRRWLQHHSNRRLHSGRANGDRCQRLRQRDQAIDPDGLDHHRYQRGCPRLHNRSRGVHAAQRALPSLLIQMPWSRRSPVKAAFVNCAPWSVLKRAGPPYCASASSTAAMQNAPSSVIDTRQLSTRCFFLYASNAMANDVPIPCSLDTDSRQFMARHC